MTTITSEQRAFLGLEPLSSTAIMKQGREALDWLAARGIIGGIQLNTVRRHCFTGEEKEYFAEKMVEIRATIEEMPKLYATDGMGDDAPVALHYFKSGMDWFITENEDPENGIMFGFACLGDRDMAELGSIGVAELTDNNVELDFYWNEKPLGKAKESLCSFADDLGACHPNKAELDSLLLALSEAGFTAVKYNYGDGDDSEMFEDDATLEDIAAEILAVDEIQLWFVKAGEEKRHWLYFVLGNEPGVIVCDYASASTELDAVITAESDKFQ
jgi:hypothetical protein